MIFNHSHQTLFEISCNAGLDVFVRDCAAAPADARRWLFMQSDFIAWKQPLGIEGFSLRNGKFIKLYRAIDDNGLLQNPVYSTLLNHVHGTFSINQVQGFIVSVYISLSANLNNKIYAINRLVYIQEGPV
jgi:hypothetical protein